MSRSPYTAVLNRPGSSGKNSPLRQSAPAPADGALSGDGGWGLNPALRSSSGGNVTPRPPNSEPNPPGLANGNGAAKSPMAFRARRFNTAGSGSDNDLSSGGSASSGFPDPTRRRSGENPTAQLSVPGASSLGRQLSSGSTSSSVSVRPTAGPSSNILASFNGHSVHASLDTSMQAMVVAGAPGKALRPKSSDTNVSHGSTSSTTASSTGSKVLKARLSEDAGGHAAGAPTLSLREKLAILQRNNKALEQQLAEAANDAQQRAAQQQEAHIAALAALQQKVAVLESQLAAQQKAAADLTQRNTQLSTAQQQLQQQLAAAKRAEKVAAATAPSGPPASPLGQDKAAADSPQSPRTPLSWDAAASSSPVSSISSSASSGNGGGPQLVHGGGGSFKRVSDDSLPPHPHVRPTSPGGSEGRLLIPANQLGRSLSQTGAAGGAGGTASESAMHTDASSVILLSNSEPDISSAGAGGGAAGGSDVRRPTSGPNSNGSGYVATAAAALGEVYLAGGGPAPVSPAAAAAGLSGAGVALLARQKKLIASLRTQLQQKDSAYAFLANEHSELEGQLKEVEASKREYAARYAFMVLDQDLDGHIRVDQVGSFDMFGCYSSAVLEYAFKHWRFASGFKGYLNMEDFVRFVTLSDDRTSKDSQRFWFAVLDLDGDGAVSAEDAKWFYDAVEKDESTFVVGFEDLWHQLLDMTQPAKPRRGFTATELWKCKLGAGVIGLLLNHNNMLLHRTTAEWGRGDFPL